MSLGAGESFYELSKKFGVARVYNPNLIHLDCWPDNRIEPRDLLPVRNSFFYEMNSPSVFKQPYRVAPEGVKPNVCCRCNCLKCNRDLLC